MGDINVFVGPMKSGKSQRMSNELHRQEIAGKDILIFKPQLDNRAGDNFISSRNGEKINAININTIEEIENYNSDVYFIDEFQFLKGDVSSIEKLAQQGKKFYISGLNLTSEKKTFGKIGDLMCIADNVELLTSVCEICKCDNAIFSYYKGNKKTDIKVGDLEYIPVCRKCYNELKKEEEK
ncbi:MAG: thymidine kinase [Candidatus Scatovivens sp.]